MRDRTGQFDVRHALAPYLGQGDLSTTLLADHATMFHALVLAAKTLVILDWTENCGAEKPVPFRLEGTVVNGFRLLDFTV